MLDARLIKCRRHGKHNFYSIRSKQLQDLMSHFGADNQVADLLKTMS